MGWGRERAVLASYLSSLDQWTRPLALASCTAQVGSGSELLHHFYLRVLQLMFLAG